MQQWSIVGLVQLDEFGHHPNDPDYQLDIRDDYTDEIPAQNSHYTTAIRYAELWATSPDAILDMPYAEFYEQTLHHKAAHLVRPVWTGRIGHSVFMLEKSTSRRFNRHAQKLRNRGII